MSEIDGVIEEGETYENTYEEREIEWKIRGVSSVIRSKKEVYNSDTFFFAGKSWRFQLYPQSAVKYGFMSLYLYKVNSNDYSVDYTYGVKKRDGSVEHLGGGFFKEGDPEFSEPCFFIKFSELEKRKSELAPSNVLTLTCLLKRGIPDSQQPRVLDRTKVKELIKLDTLSENFKDLFANKECYDTTLRMKDREYRVHKAVLIARSSVFAAMFQHDTREKKTNVVTIPDCDPESFGEFLKFLYCGKLEELSYCSAHHLYVTSDKYDVQQLKAFCMEYLMANLTVKNLCDVVTLADKYDDTKLFSAAQEFFNENLNVMFRASEWECLLKNNYRLGNKLLMAVPTIKIVK